MKIATRSTIVVLAVGVVLFVGGTILNAMPTDGANIGAALIILFSEATLGVGLVMVLGVVVWKLIVRLNRA